MKTSMLVKRLLDTILSLVLLIIISPLLIMVALLIKLTMPGPVFFNQTRTGRHGKPFTIHKFRTMKVHRATSSVTSLNDDRITPLGHFMRHTKIDELPQLINILKGDMSIVGPRPDVPGYYDTLKGPDRIILHFRPGLTGLDSMTYPHEESLLAEQPNPDLYYDTILFPHKVQLNRWWAENWSLWLDFKIVVNTAFLLIFGKVVFRIDRNFEDEKGREGENEKV